MRLLHVIGSVNPEGGGPIEAITQLALVNRARGHEIEIASLDAPSDSWVATCSVACHALGPGVSSYRWSPRLTRWLRENCHRFDAIIINGIWHYNSFGAWRALRKTSVPYFVYPHGMLDPWFKRRFPLKHLKKLLVWRWTDFRVLRDARAVLFTSEEECKLASQSFRKYTCRSIVVRYGTGGCPFPREACQKAFSERFPMLREQRILLYLGRIHEKKGVDLLLKAFSRVCSSRSESWQLIIAGPESAYVKQMKELTEMLGIVDRVSWVGMLSGMLKWGALYAADAFILPSHQENFGVSVAEALSCGVPVLISKRVNIWREICSDGAGLADEDNLPGTLRLLKTWMETPLLEQQRIRAATRCCFERHFQAITAAASLIKTIKEAL
ncbi:MAG: transferase [Verrucomicrobia bacterium]|nr:MAG: transferase [Verrucomicrobiota bacterium]